VPFVHDPVKGASAPPEVDLDRGVHGPVDSAEGAQGRSIDMPTLKERNLRLTDGCHQRNVQLAQATSAAKRAEHEPGPSVVHELNHEIELCTGRY
jgi:hypothetical protein